MEAATGETVKVGASELERLRRAEALAIVYGWCGVNRDGPREQVVSDLWNEWSEVAGRFFTGPEAHPDLDARVTESETEWRTRV